MRLGSRVQCRLYLSEQRLICFDQVQLYDDLPSSASVSLTFEAKRLIVHRTKCPLMDRPASTTTSSLLSLPTRWLSACYPFRVRLALHGECQFRGTEKKRALFTLSRSLAVYPSCDCPPSFVPSQGAVAPSSSRTEFHISSF